ncbi:MAG: hypothetical protein KatS3mg003_1487 [Candidatus Nitrosocaldaceae archaeon]|nr:MAG: hypothetical protein KatS3mg003_1487 [Candidatus Nitrosocaldaceae archaeon]
MSVINLKLPIDNSFTNLTIYEGILFLLNNNDADYNLESIDITSNALENTYGLLEDSRLDINSRNGRRLSINTTKNDNNRPNRPIIKLLNSLNIEAQSKVNRYEELLRLLKEHSNKLRLPSIVNLICNIENDLFIGDIKDKKDGYSLQLFKMERYTGITSGELDYATRQLTTYLSKEALLIALLGIYSSFVSRVRENNTTYYYFLFFTSDEIIALLNRDSDIRTAFLIKDKIIEHISDIIRKHYGEELLIAELAINTNIQDLLRTYNIDKISFLLFRIAAEGQTYKIYQQIPLIIQKKELADIYKKLAELLEPNKLILNRLSNNKINRLSNNKNPEYNNLISAIIAIYRFVILNDRQGLFILLRELLNAYNKLNNKEGKKIAEYYANRLKSLGKSIEYAI